MKRHDFRSTDRGWDLRVRSYIIHRISPFGGDPKTIINRWEEEPDVTIRRALVLTLGEFSEEQLPAAERQPLVEKLLGVFENEPDPGLHAAAEWLLRCWKQGDRLQAVLDKLRPKGPPSRAPADGRPWFVNSQGQTFVVLDAGEFTMGSPAAPNAEPGRATDETQHRVHIGRSFAIAATHVTKAEYRVFQEAAHSFNLTDNDEQKDIVRTDDSPETGMTWYEAAQYCNWLSKHEGLKECYEPNEKGEYAQGMKPKDKYLELSGYRLPTEAEWEFACRAGTVTSRYYGQSEPLLRNYAWYLSNGDGHAWPVASVKPNDFGLFDMHGNAWQWCDDAYDIYPNGAGEVSEDSGSTKSVMDGNSRVLRGGSFRYAAPTCVRPTAGTTCRRTAVRTTVFVRSELAPDFRYPLFQTPPLEHCRGRTEFWRVGYLLHSIERGGSAHGWCRPLKKGDRHLAATRNARRSRRSARS